MQANRLDGCPSTSFLTPLTCLQCSDNDFGRGDVSGDVLYEPGGRVDLLRVALEYAKHDKKGIRCHKCVMFWYDQL